jgi:hypothetical protein
MNRKQKIVFIAIIILAMVMSIMLPISANYNNNSKGSLNIYIPTANAANFKGLDSLIKNIPLPSHFIHNTVHTYSQGNNFAIVKVVNNKAFCFAWVKNSGIVTIYQGNSNGNWMEYKTISGIVPGTEKTMILTYPVNQGDNNIVTSNLSIILTGPDEGKVNTVYDFTLTINGGLMPYTVKWSASGYRSNTKVSETVFKGHYLWTTDGTKTVSVTVTDAYGQVATAQKEIKINSWEVHIIGPSSTVLYYPIMHRYPLDYSGYIGYYNIYTRYGYFTYNSILKSSDGPYYLEITEPGNYTVTSLKIGNITMNTNSFVGTGNRIHITNPDGGRYEINLSNLDGLKLGNITITATVKDSSGNFKTATFNTHIDYGEMGLFGYSTLYKTTETTGTQVYKYAVSVTETKVYKDQNGKWKVRVVVYKKWVTSNRKYDDVKSFSDAVHGGDSNLAKQVEDFQRTPQSEADDQATRQGDAKDGGKLQTDATHALFDTQNTSQMNLYTDALMQNKDDANFKFGAVAAVYAEVDNKPTYTPVQKTGVVITNEYTYSHTHILNSTNPDFSTHYNMDEYKVVRVDMFHNVDIISDDTTTNTSITSPVSIQLGNVKVIKPSDNDYSYIVMSEKNLSAREIMQVKTTQGDKTLYLKVHSDGNGNYTISDNGYAFTVHQNADNTWEYDENISKITSIPSKPTIHSLPMPLYTEEPPSIIATVASPRDSFTFSSSDPQDTMIFYKLSDGSVSTVTGTQNGVLKDANGKEIALWARSKEYLKIVPLHKGSGTIHFSASDLGGPYGIDIPVTVNVDVGDFIVTVNGTDWQNLHNNGWMTPEPGYWQYGQFNTSYEYGITKRTGYFWWDVYYISGRVKSVSTSGNAVLKTWDYSGHENTLNSAANNVPLYNLTVHIETPSTIKVRFTVQYGNDTPIVMEDSGTRNLQDASWVSSNLVSIYNDIYNLYKDEVVTYKIEISTNNGQEWTTIKSGNDTIRFIKGFD